MIRFFQNQIGDVSEHTQKLIYQRIIIIRSFIANSRTSAKTSIRGSRPNILQRLWTLDISTSTVKDRQIKGCGQNSSAKRSTKISHHE